MKFIEFLKEADIRANKGVSTEFIRNIEDVAKARHNFDVIDPSDLTEMHKHISMLFATIQNIVKPEHHPALIEICNQILQEEYRDVIESSNIEFVLKFINPNDGGILGEMPELANVPLKPKDGDNKEDDKSLGAEDSTNDLTKPVKQILIDDERTINAIDKRKILNAINQGVAKKTKDIIKFSPILKEGVVKIFGEQTAELLIGTWGLINDAFDKMDWLQDESVKAGLFKANPNGIIGAVKLDFDDDDDNGDNGEAGNSVRILAFGIDVPMIIHESVKGLYQLLKSGAIADDEELALDVKANTNTFEDEAQDFKYGVMITEAYRQFIFACKDSDRFNNMVERVYARMALDESRGGTIDDKLFLDISMSMFSCFDVSEDGKELTLNMEHFENSLAKVEVEYIIEDIIADEEEYLQRLKEWEESEKEADDYDQYVDDNADDSSFGGFLSGLGIGLSDEQEDDVDPKDMNDEQLSKLKKGEIAKLLDQALDDGDYDFARRLSKFNESVALKLKYEKLIKE